MVEEGRSGIRQPELLVERVEVQIDIGIIQIIDDGNALPCPVQGFAIGSRRKSRETISRADLSGSVTDASEAIRRCGQAAGYGLQGEGPAEVQRQVGEDHLALGDRLGGKAAEGGKKEWSRGAVGSYLRLNGCVGTEIGVHVAIGVLPDHVKREGKGGAGDKGGRHRRHDQLRG